MHLRPLLSSEVPALQSPMPRVSELFECVAVAFVWIAGIVVGQTYVVSASTAQPAKKAAQFACSPQRLRNGDTLTIRISTPHGRDLAIRGPDKRFYFLVFWQASPSDPKPIVDWDAFANTPEISLNTRELRAPVVDAGWQPVTKVFTRRGNYRVMLAANLETENAASAANTCTVFFEGTTATK